MTTTTVLVVVGVTLLIVLAIGFGFWRAGRQPNALREAAERRRAPMVTPRSELREVSGPRAVKPEWSYDVPGAPRLRLPAPGALGELHAGEPSLRRRRPGMARPVPRTGVYRQSDDPADDPAVDLSGDALFAPQTPDVAADEPRPPSGGWAADEHAADDRAQG